MVEVDTKINIGPAPIAALEMPLVTNESASNGAGDQ